MSSLQHPSYGTKTREMTATTQTCLQSPYAINKEQITFGTANGYLTKTCILLKSAKYFPMLKTVRNNNESIILY